MIREDAKNKQTKAGFTLIEVITVLLVVSLGMIGVLSLIVQNIQSQSLNKNTLIAYQLAQEGVEFVRQIRDSNWRADPIMDWREGLVAGSYYMDYTDTSLHLVPEYVGLESDYGNLRQDANGMYLSNPLSPQPGTIFSRIISLADYSVDGSDGLRVVSKIYWNDHGRSYNYFLETLLYDWY